MPAAKNPQRRKGRSFSDESVRLRQARGQILYEGASPDEVALVGACRKYGVVYKGRKDGCYVISYLGEDKIFKILRVLDFDATRKRMSIAVTTGNGSVSLFVKGEYGCLM